MMRLFPGTLSLALLCLVISPASAQNRHSDYDDVDPWSGFEPPGAGMDSAGVSSLLAGLSGANPVVCQLAVSSLGNHWGHGDDELQIGILAGEVTAEREREALGRSITDPGALTLLGSALGDPHPCVRRAAARMLGESKTSAATGLLRTSLHDRDARVREAAALGLADAEDPASLHDLSKALEDPDPTVVRMAAYALGELSDARAVKPLGNLLSSKNAAARVTAAWALGEIEDIRAAERLTPLVKIRTPESGSPQSMHLVRWRITGPPMLSMRRSRIGMSGSGVLPPRRWVMSRIRRPPPLSLRRSLTLIPSSAGSLRSPWVSSMASSEPRRNSSPC